MNQLLVEYQDCKGNQVSEDELYERLSIIVKSQRTVPGALIPVLQTAQNLFGYLPEKALRMISKELKLPYSEVAGVVGFYSYFSTTPKGKHTIRVCLGTACYVRGGQDVLKAMSKELEISVGGTTKDRKFSLEVGRCFGACGLAPVVMVDDETYQRVSPSKITDILNSFE
ncbi:MAG TPA: NAD(P)H-dependent oxidoreductase subunit E [Prolixibacteraceae bacterium]|jgi:NADH:ubiquinone oxidoreductase subunit E|nr:NAD(P)H-dependent oxidoreductase subunit E [Prolixibacteraceae bacterium]